jgi:hypothetical protein
MTLHRDRGEIIFECEACDETHETGTRDFDDALADLRRQNWRVCRHRGDWAHLCPKHAHIDLNEKKSEGAERWFKPQL